MAIYCGEDCVALCDFCIHFKEISYDELEDYSADGICETTGEEVSFADECERFRCFRCKDE